MVSSDWSSALDLEKVARLDESRRQRSSKRLPLYDQFGHQIPPAPHTGPGEPLNDKHTTSHRLEPKQSPDTAKGWWPRWLKGWKLFLELGGIAILIAIYDHRPILSVTSLTTSDLHNTNGAKISITNSGMKMKDVKVQCVSNKVVFQDRNTLELDRFVVINEYAVPDVGTGESFTGDCNFVWSLWTKPTDGFFLLGAGVAGLPQMGISFLFNNGTPSFVPGVPIPARIKPDFTGYSYNQVTAVDGSFVILYSWLLSWVRQKHVIHMIAQRTDDGLKWRVAPKSEPVIPNGRLAGGFIFTAKGNGERWGIEMTRGTPP